MYTVSLLPVVEALAGTNLNVSPLWLKVYVPLAAFWVIKVYDPPSCMFNKAIAPGVDETVCKLALFQLIVDALPALKASE